MSKLVKEIKKGASSATSTIKGALKGDFSDIVNVATLGGLNRTEWALGKVGDAIKPKIPDPLPAPGLLQSNTDAAAPNVDLSATESIRRARGQALGTRKLRIPLGGLR